MSMREAYQQRMEAQLKELSATITLLKAKADRARAEAKVTYCKELDGLHSKLMAIRGELQELKAADEAWDELRARLERAWGELKKGYDSAASQFR
jgi:chromosome segregation ATPase